MKKKLFILFMICFLTFTCKIYAYETYKIGDEVTYNGEKYYVIENSDEDVNYLALLKAESLTLEEVGKYAVDIKEDDSIGRMYFYNKDTNNPTLNYNETDIKTVVDNWADKEFGNDLVNIDGYKARLMNDSDIANLGYGNEKSCSSKKIWYYYIPKNEVSFQKQTLCDINSGCIDYYIINGKSYHVCSTTKEYYQDGDLKLCTNSGETIQISKYADIIKSSEICESFYTHQGKYTSEKKYDWMDNNEDFWTMITRVVTNGSEKTLWLYKGSDNDFEAISTGNNQLTVRPVVNVKKSSLGSKTDYNIGDEVTYKGEKYNVLYDVKASDNYVTLLKYDSLTDKQVKQSLESGSRGYVPFYNSDSCHTGVFSGCVNDYATSNIKNIVDKWYEDTVKKSDQKKVGKYKARLLTTDELIDKFGYQSINGSINFLQYTEDTPEWIYSEPSGYWAMDDFADNDSQIATINKIVYSTYVYGISGVRPVIYISKCGIGDNACQKSEKLVCKEGTKERIEKVIKYNSYLIGDVVSIKGDDYYVLEDSSEQKSTLTLLKDKPISEELINKYTDNKYEDDYGSIPFYENETCKEIDDYPFGIDEGCSTSYDKSLVKDVLEKWASDTFDDDILEEIDGTKVRLLTTDELVDKYGFVVGKQGTDANSPMNQQASDDTPEFLENIETWTTSAGEDGVYSLSNGSTNLNKPYDKAAITPIINVDKCAIDGGCYEEEEIVGCDPVDSEPESIVNVDNTLSMLSMVGFILGGALIIFGISLLGYNYIGLKKKTKK